MRKIKIKDIYIIAGLFTHEELKTVHDCIGEAIWSDDELSDNQFFEVGEQGEILGEGSSCRVASLILEEKNKIIKENIEKDFNCTVGEEGIGTVVRYTPGWTLEYHADCWSDLPTYSGLPSRDISSILYLTENFEGGSLVFPDLDVEIQPLAGSAIYFPSDEDHMHTVIEVESGDRSACTGFWHILNKEKN